MHSVLLRHYFLSYDVGQSRVSSQRIHTFSCHFGAFVVVSRNALNFLYEPAHKKRVLITQATSKGSGETAHKRSLARTFAVRRHVVRTLINLQAKRHICSPNGGLRMRIWKTTNRETIRSFFQVPDHIRMVLENVVILYLFYSLWIISHQWVTLRVSDPVNRDVRKRTFWHVRPTKTQISLRIRPVWSSLSARKKLSILAIQNAQREEYESELNLRRAHMSEGTFSDAGAPLGKTTKKIMTIKAGH